MCKARGACESPSVSGQASTSDRGQTQLECADALFLDQLQGNAPVCNLEQANGAQILWCDLSELKCAQKPSTQVDNVLSLVITLVLPTVTSSTGYPIGLQPRHRIVTRMCLCSPPIHMAPGSTRLPSSTGKSFHLRGRLCTLASSARQGRPAPPGAQEPPAPASSAEARLSSRRHMLLQQPVLMLCCSCCSVVSALPTAADAVSGLAFSYGEACAR